ncbi:MAG: family 1 extracellular solute-binding protein [Paenibacillaceae bacterium]|nr:family 1 extracellular solute-binding protein [Paenibacillaceae bacterium]
MTLSLSAVIALSGCGGGGETGTGGASAPADNAKPTEPAVDNSPVTVKFFAAPAYITDEDFPLLLTEPLKKKYPNITLELVRPAKGAQLEDLVAAGDVPDLIILYNGAIGTYSDLGLLTDLRPQLKAHNVDLSRFKPGVIEAFSGDKGEVYGLPYAMNINATYYNQDIFDKFGVSYPSDGMLWDDAIQLARKLTREESGVKYKGLDYDSLFRPSFALSLPLVDKKTNKAALNTDSWKKVFSLEKEIEDIPGNRKEGGAADAFLTKRVLAMDATINLFSRLEEPTKQGLRWDVAQYPSFKEKPNTVTYPDLHEIMVSSASKHKDAALRVAEVLTSDEVQLISVRKTGRVSALVNKQLEEQFGADMPFTKGKRLASIFKSKSAPTPYQSVYDAGIKTIINKAWPQYRDGKIDVNTFLSQIEEQSNQLIDETNSK